MHSNTACPGKSTSPLEEPDSARSEVSVHVGVENENDFVHGMLGAMNHRIRGGCKDVDVKKSLLEPLIVVKKVERSLVENIEHSHEFEKLEDTEKELVSAIPNALRLHVLKNHNGRVKHLLKEAHQKG